MGGGRSENMRLLPRSNTMYENIYGIITFMEKYGGSFVKQLAILHELGDSTNKIKLETTFKEYFDKYYEMTKRASQSQ